MADSMSKRLPMSTLLLLNTKTPKPTFGRRSLSCDAYASTSHINRQLHRTWRLSAIRSSGLSTSKRRLPDVRRSSNNLKRRVI